MSDLLADYQALRVGQGAYRLARDLLQVEGPDAADYLQGQCSQDLSALALGESTDSLVLTPEGKVTALVRVLRAADDVFVLDTDPSSGPALATRLGRFKLRAKLAIEPLDGEVVALRGEGVGQPGAPVGADEHPPVALAYDWNGWRGVDLVYRGRAPDAPPDGFRWCAAAAWEACRIEAGIPRAGAELDERTIPAEVPGLVERTVSFTKGCYTGQELVARLDARGNRVARRLVGLVVPSAGTGPEPAAVATVSGAELFVVGDRPGAPEPAGAGAPKVVGRCTSAAWSPGLGGVVGLAYLHRSVAVPATVGLRTVGGGPPLVAEARSLPLA
jgi:folate-binding protein YgfZ